MCVTLQELAFRKATELLNKGEKFNLFSVAEQAAELVSYQLDDEQRNENIRLAEAAVVSAIKAFCVVQGGENG
jgi:hypothetical protein